MKPARSGALLFLVATWAAASLPSRADTLTFREGEAGYAGTRDTYLEQNTPSTVYGGAPTLRWDGDQPATTGLDDYVLLRFEGIVGSEPGQIPPGAVVNSAVLTYTVANTGDAGELREALVAWTEASTFGSFCGAACGATQLGPLVGTATGSALTAQSVNVTASVQAWVDGAPSLGWIVAPVGIDGVEIASRESTTLQNRPLLTVTFDETQPVTLVRRPYLQMGTPTSMTLVWRTDVPSDSRVRYGTAQGTLDQSAETSSPSTDHVVTLAGLSPGTRYYYDVGSTTEMQDGGTAEHYFVTSPEPGSPTPFRAWVVGDSGTGDGAQAQVRDAMLAATGSARPDLFLHMGDIAYYSGTEEEFTAYHFAPYRDILRHTVLWTTLGNHEGTSTVSGAPGPSIGPYYDAFVLPEAGEAGGEPSGTEAYYSFDHANVHFVSLNSYQVDRSIEGAMAAWLEADLAATKQPWIVAFWHHPPYTHGTHDSDFEVEHIEMRENLLPILEAGGVDVVLGGHSHGYERSFLIDGAYATPTPDLATLVAEGHVIDGGDGKPEGNGVYRKGAGVTSHEGAVYVVAGHGGAALGGAMDHPVMYFSEALHGSVLLDVGDDTLTLTNLRSTGIVSDTCTLVKAQPAVPIVDAIVPPRGATVTGLATVEVIFSGAVRGVDASDLTVNGVPAASVVAETSYRYRFTLGAVPAPEVASVVLVAGGIAHASNSSLAFAGDSWRYKVGCKEDSACAVLSQGCAAGRCVGGSCVTGHADDGTPCDDGSVCTRADVCLAGACAGAIPVPADVTNLTWRSDKVTLAWDDTAVLKTGGDYDVARGPVRELPVSGAGTSTCLETALGVTKTVDGALPAAGEPSWYLVRGNTACSPGTWGRQGEHGAPATERFVAGCP